MKIKKIFQNYIEFPIDNFFTGIKNLIIWLPVIWKDRNWDGYYIFKILEYKIKNQAKYIGDRDFHTRAKRDAEIMNLCCRLIDKVNSEYYNLEYFDYHTSAFKNYDIGDSSLKGVSVEITEEKFDEYFTKYPLIYKKIIKKYPDKDKHFIALYIGQYNHKRARKLLFKLLKKNIEKWWD